MKQGDINSINHIINKEIDNTHNKPANKNSFYLN